MDTISSWRLYAKRTVFLWGGYQAPTQFRGSRTPEWRGSREQATSVLTSQCSHRVDHPVAILPTTAQTRIPKKKTTHERSKERRKVDKKKRRDGRGAWESRRNRTRGKEEEAKLSGGSRERKRKKVKEANAKRRMRYDRGSKFTHPAVIAFGMRTYDR